tara:strand:+ start:165 stop:1253 length:1089 start_codon:yes stop_codon:yes gene_type:complete
MIKINARSPFYLDVDATEGAVLPPPIEPPAQTTQTLQVACGTTHNTGTDVGNTIYELNTLETGNVSIVITGNDVPIRYKVEWDGVEQADTKFIGRNDFDGALLLAGVAQSDIATASPSNKNTTITFNKTTSTPTLVKITALAPLVNDQYSLQFTCPVAPIVIDTNTQINLWFDDSGSMDGTLAPLQDMVAGNLKTCLIQFYGNDSAKYDSLVKVRLFKGERMFREAASLPDVAGATNVWNFVFGDEATYIYMATQFDNQIRTINYEADMANLRSVLLNNPTGYVVPVMFQVQSYLNELKKFYQAIENGEGTYFPPFGLADKTSEVKFYYDVEDGITYANDPTYYRNLVIQAVNDLGFSITCP